MDGSIDYAPASIGITEIAADNGYIDAPANLAHQKVWLFSGYNDGLVRRGAMNAVAEYYEHYVGPGNVFYKTNNHAPHALITDDFGGACFEYKAPYIENCNYDAAGLLLEHIYGRLNPPDGSLSSSPQAFDQTEFQDLALAGNIGLADTGYIYVPTECETQTCRVHVVFHGCKQYAEDAQVGDAVYKHGGYNEWADTNKIIVLYPQTVGSLLNPKGCWDFWGFDDSLPRSREFARKTGYQISAIKKMLDRLAEGPPHGGSSSNTFGIPHHFEAVDTTPSSVELIWQPNSSAAGFNIYRSFSSAGTYTKINDNPVRGASFVDRELTPTTTYYYRVRALDASNQESAPTSPVQKTTASEPPACDPYLSDNATHVARLRAFVDLHGNTRALGSGDYMGPSDLFHFSHLTRNGGLWPSYHVGYCP